MGVAVLAQVWFVAVRRPRLWDLARILVLPNELSSLVKSSIVEPAVVVALRIALLPLARLVFEIHVFHGLA
jgi:hypothetical protein